MSDELKEENERLRENNERLRDLIRMVILRDGELKCSCRSQGVIFTCFQYYCCGCLFRELQREVGDE